MEMLDLLQSADGVDQVKEQLIALMECLYASFAMDTTTIWCTCTLRKIRGFLDLHPRKLVGKHDKKLKLMVNLRIRMACLLSLSMETCIAMTSDINDHYANTLSLLCGCSTSSKLRKLVCYYWYHIFFAVTAIMNTDE